LSKNRLTIVQHSCNNRSTIV